MSAVCFCLHEEKNCNFPLCSKDFICHLNVDGDLVCFIRATMFQKT